MKDFDHTTQLADTEKLLQKFSELTENWNSYGGSPITPNIIAAARDILYAGINLNLPSAWTAPGGDGGIGIQWDTDTTELYIDIVPRENTTYSLTPKTGDQPGVTGVLTTENLSLVLGKLAPPAA